jgi:hypothetical protein
MGISRENKERKTDGFQLDRNLCSLSENEFKKLIRDILLREEESKAELKELIKEALKEIKEEEKKETWKKRWKIMASATFAGMWVGTTVEFLYGFIIKNTELAKAGLLFSCICGIACLAVLHCLFKKDRKKEEENKVGNI